MPWFRKRAARVSETALRKKNVRFSKTLQLSKTAPLSKTSSRSTAMLHSKTTPISKATQLNEAAPSCNEAAGVQVRRRLPARPRFTTRQRCAIPPFVVAAVPRLYSADGSSGAGNGSAIGVLVPNRRASSTGVNPNAL
jgi:hypothetical protein